MLRVCGVCGRAFYEEEGCGRYCSVHCQLADVDVDEFVYEEEEVEYAVPC